MKKCSKCGKEFADSFDFCVSCGEKLEQRNPSSNRKALIAVACVVVAIVAVVIVCRENAKIKEQEKAIEQSQLNKAVEEYKNTPTKYDLTIDDWDYRFSDNYTYITGHVSNDSTKGIGYYEIGVKFMDSSGDVIDTDWTNGIDLDPGDTQEFEIMYRGTDWSKVRVYIKEVS